ncbi:MAG: PD40 domain-containing protein [Bryobacterales bacterium]|nr:PD40 domain-containing protein [Bryobacterales bacterium]
MEFTGRTSQSPVRFSVFEFDCASGELRRKGVRQKLQDQPARILALLLEHPGEVVTRERLQAELWPRDTFVEFDAGLNAGVKKLRYALGDSAETPLFIETVPRKGYRFIAPVAPPQAAPPVNEPAPITDQPAPNPTSAPAHRLRIYLPVLIAGAMALAAGMGWWIGRSTSQVQPLSPGRFEIRLPDDQSQVNQITISRDGSKIVYVARRNGVAQLFRRDLDDAAIHPIPGTEGAQFPFFSPDGSRAGFFADNKLKTVALDGTESNELARLAPGFLNTMGYWDPDGSIYFENPPPRQGTGQPAVWRVASNGSSEPSMLPLAAGPNLAFPFLQARLPGTESFILALVATPLDRSLAVYSPRAGNHRTLVEHAMGGQVLPTGHLLYYWANSMFAAPLDSAKGKLLRPGVAVLNDVAENNWRGGAARVSDNGTLVYIPATAPNATLVWVDRKGRETPLPVPPGSYVPLDLSADDKRLLAMRPEPGPGRWSLWSYDLGANTWQRLARGGGVRTAAVWSPDGTEIIYASDEHGGVYSNLFRRRIGDNMPPERLTINPAFGQFPSSWSGAANALAFSEGIHPDTNVDVWVLPLSAYRKPEAFLHEPASESLASFSPDGKWLAYVKNAGSHPGIFVRSYPSGGGETQLSKAGSSPCWSPDGREIFYRAGGAVMSVPFEPGPRPRSGEAKLLFSGSYMPGNLWTRSLLVSHDGKRFLLARREEPKSGQINVVLNWFSELHRLTGAR